MNIYFPEVVQVIPHDDYTVTVFFSDGKIVEYDVKSILNKEVFKPLKNIDFFMERCTVLNDTLAWDIDGNYDETTCIDIDAEMLYQLNMKNEVA